MQPSILFCAHLGSVAYASRQRFETLQALGCRMSPFDMEPFERRSLAERVSGRLRGQPFTSRVLERFERAFLEQVARTRPDILWIEKGVMLRPEGLRQARRLAPQASIVSYQVDNPFGTRAHERPLWASFVDGIPEYDVHFVLRSVDLENYRAHGACAVRLTRHHYFPSLHMPRPGNAASPDRQHGVVFVGTAVDTRIAQIARLMGETSIDLHVYGGLWNRHAVCYRHWRRFHERITGDDYAALVSASKVCLGYVSASNCDEYTHRSIEIPACGGFLLGERTPTHMALYEEGQEAEFFETHQECVDKIRYYLDHDQERRRIAEAGRRRCLNSSHSAVDVMRDALREIGQLCARRPAV
jgi:spore maturation protein CgeB